MESGKGREYMGKVHINVRVDSRNIEAIDEIAEREGSSRSAAVDKVLDIGLQQIVKQQSGETDESPEVIAAMQAHIDALSAQMAIKDGQIEQYSQLLDQAQQVQARITMALPVAQERPQEQPQEHSQGAATAQHQPQDDISAPGQPQEGEQTRKRGFWASLWS